MNYREMRAKLISSYGKFLFFPDDPEVPKLCSIKSFNYMVIGDDITLYAHRAMEEQIENELEEGYNVIYGEPDLKGKYFVSPYSKKIHQRENFVNGMEILKKAMRKPFDEEIEILREAGEKIRSSLDEFFSRLSIGIKEKDAKNLLDCILLQNGFDGFLYPTLVVSGKRTKYFFPKSGEEVIKEGEIIYIDSSPVYRGYPLNFSRIVFTEERDLWIQSLKKLNNLYDSLSRIIKSGVSCNFIDSYIRDRIGNFPHYSAVPAGGFYMPYAPMDSLLEENMVFTLTPSIYLEDGLIRVKRNAVVKKEGIEFID